MRRLLAGLCAGRYLQHAVAADYSADGLAALSLGEPFDDGLFDLNYAIGEDMLFEIGCELVEQLD